MLSEHTYHYNGADHDQHTISRMANPENQASLSVFAILSINVIIDGILPWALIWLSNALLFDIPGWSAEALLAVSLTISSLIISVSWLQTAHIGRSRPAVAQRAANPAAPAHQYRIAETRLSTAST